MGPGRRLEIDGDFVLLVRRHDGEASLGGECEGPGWCPSASRRDLLNYGAEALDLDQGLSVNRSSLGRPSATDTGMSASCREYSEWHDTFDGESTHRLRGDDELTGKISVRDYLVAQELHQRTRGTDGSGLLSSVLGEGLGHTAVL